MDAPWGSCGLLTFSIPNAALLLVPSRWVCHTAAMHVEVKSHNGTPTVFLDGLADYANFNLLSPLDGEYRAQSLRVARKFGRLRVKLYSIDACDPEWPGPSANNPSPFDFGTVGPRLQCRLDVNPNADFLRDDREHYIGE